MIQIRKLFLGGTLAVLAMLIITPGEIWAMLEPFPKVTSVSPTAVKPGSMIKLSGVNFSYTGVDTGCMVGTKKIPSCPWKTVIAAYKSPRTHSDYPGSKPDFRLAIVSLSSDIIQAKVPDSVSSGDGVYNLGLFLEFDAAVVGQQQAAQLVGLARYDTITLTGAGEGKSTATATTVTPTVVKPATVSPTEDVKEQAEPTLSKTVEPGSKVASPSGVFRKITSPVVIQSIQTFLGRIFSLFGFFNK